MRILGSLPDRPTLIEQPIEKIILYKEVFYLNFPKIRKHFPGKYCVCLDFISSTILTKPAAARLPGTKNTASFQAFCVSPAYCRNELGFGISLHLHLHDDNQQTREKLS